MYLSDKDQNHQPLLCVVIISWTCIYFFFTSNTTTEMLFTFKRDKLSSFCVKKLSPVRFMAHTISLCCNRLFFMSYKGCLFATIFVFILFKYIVWLSILCNDTSAAESNKKFEKFTDTYCFLSKSVYCSFSHDFVTGIKNGCLRPHSLAYRDFNFKHYFA